MSSPPATLIRTTESRYRREDGDKISVKFRLGEDNADLFVLLEEETPEFVSFPF